MIHQKHIDYLSKVDNTLKSIIEKDSIDFAVFFISPFIIDKINILNLKYPETFVAGAGNLAIFDIEYKPIYFLNKHPTS